MMELRESHLGSDEVNSWDETRPVWDEITSDCCEADWNEDFFWDGTELFEHIEFVHRNPEGRIVIKDGLLYARIPRLDIPCICVKRKSMLPVIIDEIKYIFGIKQLGTRYTKRYVVYPGFIENEIWYEDIRLSNAKFKLTYSNRRDVRDILAFRYLLGLTSINTRSIIIRHNTVYDFYDNTVHEFAEKAYITDAALREWFTEIDLYKTIRLMLKKTPFKDQIGQLFYVRSKLTEVIERVDKSYIHMVSSICDRIMDCIDHVS